MTAKTKATGRQSDHQRLFGVGRTTREYQYRGKKSFRDALGSEHHAFEKATTGDRNQYIIFSNVDKQTFGKDFSDSDPCNKLLCRSYWEYIPTLKLLLIKMTTELHEQAYMALHNMFIRKLSHMNNLDLELQSIGQAEKESNSHRKKANQSYRPLVLPTGHSNYWPTVIIDAAYYESRGKVAADARWWLTESVGDVKTALTITVHQPKREITVDKWGLIRRPTRQDEQKTVAEVIQHVVVSQVTAEQPVRVTGDPLTVPFDHFFLRSPGPNEGDLVLDKWDLERIATLTWNAHSKV